MISGLKSYPRMKDSGIPWLRDIPEHWEVRRIKTLFREKDERSGDGSGLLLSLTRALGLLPHSEASNRIASAGDLSKYKICRSGDLVMNRMQAWSGMFAVSPYEGLVSPDYSVFGLTRKDEIQYFKHLFKTPVLVDQFAQSSKGIGSGFNRLYTPEFGAVPVTVPSFPEQVAIAKFLDHYDRKIRRYIRAKQKMIKLLEEQKQAIIHRAVTGQVDVRTGKPYPSYKPSGVEWLGDVPENWEVQRLKTNVVNVADQTTSCGDDESYVALEHVESWTGRIKDVGPGTVFNSQVKRFKAGDILFGKLRPYLAKVARPDRKGVCVGEFLVLRPRGCEQDARYLEQFLRSKLVIDAINASTFGAKMPRADWTFVGSLEQLIPPLPEQLAIVEYLNWATADIDTAITRAHREIELLREYRTRLITDVVTGKLDVREAAARLPDETEEPEPLEAAGELIDADDPTGNEDLAEALPEEVEA